MKYLKWIAIGIGILLVLMLARAVLESRDARIRLEARLEAQQEFRKQLDLQKGVNDKKAAAEKAALQEEFDKVKTAKQAVKYINQYVPVREPIELLPDAPSAKLNEIQLLDAATYVHLCEECDKDRANYIANESIAKRKITSLEGDLAAAKATVRGGTKWQRFGRAAKHVGIGVAIGVAVGAAAKR